MVGANRLRQVLVHAGRQTAFAIVAHHLSGHRDDRHMPAGSRLALTDDLRRLQAIHLRHLHIHQHAIKRLSKEHVDRLAPVVRHSCLMPAFFQQRDGEHLIEPTVLDQQHSQHRACFHGGSREKRRCRFFARSQPQ